MITRLLIKNFRSIAEADVALDGLTVLVGPNGSGKSNTIDALRFVADALYTNLREAIDRRRSFRSVLRAGDQISSLIVSLHLRFDDPQSQNKGVVNARYAIELEEVPTEPNGFRVAREWCRVTAFEHVEEFDIRNGNWHKSMGGFSPQILPGKLVLPSVSASGMFGLVFNELTNIRFYSQFPALRQIDSVRESGHRLAEDGHNAASVVRELVLSKDGESVLTLMRSLVPGLEQIEVDTTDDDETDRLWFVFADEHGRRHRFRAMLQSEGTAKLLGLLLSLYQPDRPPLVVIEEPEALVHPGLAESLAEIFADRATKMQIIITTHSPELIDADEVPLESLRVVERVGGVTRVMSLDDVSTAVIRDRLTTAGQLLSQDELRPNTPPPPAAIAPDYFEE